jgi:hypothetical protein
MKHIDFNALNTTLKGKIDTLLSRWLPDGVRDQHE